MRKDLKYRFMLCQFTVKNYKSIREEMTFDTQAAAIMGHRDRIIKTEGGESFLPVSVIYGPNGGGKSNVMEALHTLDAKVLRPLCATCDKMECEYKARKIPVEPFAFSEETRKKPTEFEVFFRTDIAEYRYILYVKQDAVVYERLDRIKLDTGRRSALFVRNWEGSRIKLSEEISETLPLLSYSGITYKKNEVISDVIELFEESIDFLNYGNSRQELRTAIAKTDEVKKLVLEMIREMDLDIEDFRIEEREENRIEVYTKHTVNGYSTELTLSEESSGTGKLFGLLPFIARSLVVGTTLVIDELDAKIHPVLLRYVIMLFNNMEINKNGAQLIFTSHDLSTMNNDIFRRDEIWFVAKGKEQNSKLNTKGESVRMDAKYAKQYLEGKYGADSYLKKIIDWSDVNA